METTTQQPKQLGIHFGALCDPIGEQIKAQGFKYSQKTCKEFQEQEERILHLWFGKLLTDKEKIHAQDKLYKQIVAHVKLKNKIQ